MEMVYLAMASFLSFWVAIAAFFLKRHRLLIGCGCATVGFAAASLVLLVPALKMSGKAVPGWFFDTAPIVGFCFIAAFLLGAAAACTGIYRLTRKPEP